MKICPVGAELIHPDRQTDRHEKANSQLFEISRKRLRAKKRSTVRVPSLRALFRSGNYLMQNMSTDYSHAQCARC